ncbi:MAG TPA: hypothetical protein VM115_11490 [Vicinamibacterales bacterium]|nr:hypothetical protein [Vicinamibacterales bacterium]
MFAQKVVHTLCGVALLGLFATSATTARSFDTRRTTRFTFSRAVQIPGATLAPGTYIFEIANPNEQADIVRVLSADRQEAFLLKFTIPVYRRADGNLKATITLGESPAGTPPPVKAWYPQSEARGREFLY